MGGVKMNSFEERQRNQAAFRQLGDFIKKTYPQGQFLALTAGKIIADAGSFQELDSKLLAMNQDQPDVLVVQAGVEYPESAVIFM
jgi:hypothetical protein